jgi:hypothetical protein
VAGVMFGKSQLFVREGISEVHHRRDEPPAADRLAGYRLLGAVARTPPAGVPSYLLRVYVRSQPRQRMSCPSRTYPC